MIVISHPLFSDENELYESWQAQRRLLDLALETLSELGFDLEELAAVAID